MLTNLCDRLHTVIPHCRSVQDAIFEVLKEAILQGFFWPGQEINQVELARSMYVSRIPVRESLRRLEAVGLVECSPFKKARVLMPDPTYIDQVYSTRALLEGEAVKIAAKHISEQQISVLGDLLRRIDELSDTGGIHQVDVLSKQYHWLLVQACDNPVLSVMLKSVWAEFPKYAFTMEPYRVGESRDEHYRIVDALRWRDADTAKRLLTANLEKGGRRFSDFIRARRAKRH